MATVQGWRVAVVGSTGAVGEAIIELLEQRQFPLSDLNLLASDHSAGTTVRFNGKTILVHELSAFDWQGIDIAFFAAGSHISQQYAREVASQGCVVIDLSGHFALDYDVPLIIPSVNPDLVADYRNCNILAIANSLSCQLLTTIKPLIDTAGLSRLQVTNLIAASHFGKSGIDELAGQSTRLLNGLPIEEGRVFNQQLAFNLLPMLADEQGSVALERDIVEQVRKVLQDYSLPLTINCLQVPVFYGHAQIVNFETMRPISIEEIGQQLSLCSDIELYQDGDFPTPVADASGNQHLSIGCIRQDYGNSQSIQLWSVADNIRFSAALMAVQSAEILLRDYF